jgi:hypothetical protein
MVRTEYREPIGGASWTGPERSILVTKDFDSSKSDTFSPLQHDFGYSSYYFYFRFPFTRNKRTPVSALRSIKKTRKKATRETSKEAILKLRVRGPGIRSGHIPVPELIRICQDAQKAITRQAESMAGRKANVHPGPSKMAIQQECTLELVGIKKGSTTLQFGFTKPQLTLPGVLTFGEDAILAVAQTIKSLGNGNKRENIDAGVLEGLYDLGGIVTSKKISELEWIVPRAGTAKQVRGKINSVVRERVAQRLSSPRKEKTQIDGVLDMADFKPQDEKCRIDPAIGASVMCTFDTRQANKIQSLLRRSVRVKGTAIFLAHATRIDSLHIEDIDPLPSLSLGEGNFFASQSLQELAEAQKIKPIKDVSGLAGTFPNDEDIDDFLKEIYSARE